MLAKANQTYYGKVLQSGAQGTVQNTKDGLVYHPQIQDLKTGKEYTLTYTENQVKILENIEISRKLENHRTMKSKDSPKTPYFAITATFDSFSSEYHHNSKHG